MTLNELRRMFRITESLDGNTPVILRLGATDTEPYGLNKVSVGNNKNGDFVELYINMDGEPPPTPTNIFDVPELLYGTHESENEVKSKQQTEREMYAQAIQGRTNRQAAKLLGVSERTVYRKILQYNL